jgi:hypothetical protein
MPRDQIDELRELEDFDPDEEIVDEDLDGEEPDVEEAELEDCIAPMTPEESVQYLAAAAMQSGSFVRGGGIVLPTGAMRCRICGCSEERACVGGCVWAAPNLCSQCVA